MKLSGLLGQGPDLPQGRCIEMTPVCQRMNLTMTSEQAVVRRGRERGLGMAKSIVNNGKGIDMAR